MNILYVVIGAGLIILGRKYIWLFTAGIVYFIFLEFIATTHFDLPYMLLIFVALILGAAGALLSSIFRPVGLSLSVFLSAGFLFSLPAAAYKWFPGQAWLPYAAGGILGLVLVAGVSNWTLVVLSSLIGALMITRGISFGPASSPVAFLGFALTGIVLQLLILLIERPAVGPVEEGQTQEENETSIVGNPQNNSH
jgi:hypothetical protein